MSNSYTEDPTLVRKFITATIVSTDFLKALKGFWIPQLVGTNWCWVAEKCFQYFEQYEVAPGKNIETIFSTEGQKLDPDTRADLESILSGLSREYEEESEPLNAEHLIQECRKWFSLELCINTSFLLQEAAEAGDLESCNEILADHNKHLEKAQQTSAKPLQAITAKGLQQMHLPEPEWLVRGLIPVGVTLLAGKPKSGKSYLVLNLAVQLALGFKVFNMIETEPTEILYLGLEDPLWMIKKRLAQILDQHQNHPDNLYFFSEWPRLHEGGLPKFEQWLKEHPNTRMIVIDTLQKVRQPIKGKGINLYAEDYRAVEQLQELGKKHNLGIIINHHTKKSKEGDVFDEISGSTGLTGSTDSNMVFRKVPGPNNQNVRHLHYTGRVISEGVMELRFENHKFTLDGMPPGMDDGTLKKPQLSTQRQIIIDILESVEGPPYQMTRKELIEACGDKVGKGIETTLSQMVEAGHIVRPKPGIYIHPDRYQSQQANLMCLEAGKKVMKLRVLQVALNEEEVQQQTEDIPSDKGTDFSEKLTEGVCPFKHEFGKDFTEHDDCQKCPEESFSACMNYE